MYLNVPGLECVHESRAFTFQPSSSSSFYSVFLPCDFSFTVSIHRAGADTNTQAHAHTKIHAYTCRGLRNLCRCKIEKRAQKWTVNPTEEVVIRPLFSVTNLLVLESTFNFNHTSKSYYVIGAYRTVCDNPLDGVVLLLFSSFCRWFDRRRVACECVSASGRTQQVTKWQSMENSVGSVVGRVRVI